MANIEGSNFIFRITIFATVMMQISMATHILVSVPALFLFGDSVLDAGTNNYINNSSARANFPPYGETYFHRPTGRWSDGRNIGDFIAQYLHLPLAKPYLEHGAYGNYKYGANFASGGSGLRDLTSSSSGVIPFKTQLRQFQTVATRFNYDHISRSIFLMSTGNNDNREYLSNSTLQQIFTASEFVKCIMEIYEKGLLALYKDGARKFVLIETGPAGCAPKGRLDARNQNETGCLTEANQLSLIFDAALSNLTTKLTATLQDATFLHAKVFNLSQELINNGPKYGLMNTTNACCGAGPFNAAIKCGTTRNSTTCQFPSQYFFWDLMHPTEATNRIISKALWRGNTSYIEPFNIHTLATSIPSNSFVAR